MLNQRINTNNPIADQAMIDSLIDDILHHKRHNSEDSGVGEGQFESIFFGQEFHSLFLKDELVSIERLMP